MNLPNEVPDISLAQIAKRTETLEAEALADPSEWPALTADRETQEYFLNNFRKTFNISLSLALVNKRWNDFARWKSTEIYFVEEFNGIHKHWQSRVMASAASRAVGYTRACDPLAPTTSGLLEDAQGSVIYDGADSKLTMAFLSASHPDQFGNKTDININAAPPLRDITPDDTGQDAADLYSLLVKKQES